MWREGHRSGNPINHELVSEYLAGYERYAFDELDYSKTRVVPVTQEVHYRLIESLRAKADEADDAWEVATLLRDACAFAFLWETGHRGNECVKLRTTDFTYENTECTECWPDIVSKQLNAQWRVVVECSGGAKMRKTRHPGNLVLERVTAEDPRVGLTLLDLLPVYADSMAAIGLVLDGEIFMARRGRAHSFKTMAYNSAALGRRLVWHLRREGVWIGQTLHGIRRGSAQEAHHRQGQPLDEIARKRLWRDPESVEDYVHTTRHRERLVKPKEEEASGSGRR